MPYKSKAQQAFMHAKHPGIAKKFDKETSKAAFKGLPEKANPKAKAAVDAKRGHGKKRKRRADGKFG